jgi:hypothetical protein
MLEEDFQASSLNYDDPESDDDDENFGGGDGGFLAGLESASFDNDNDASGSPTLLAASRVVSSRVVSR